MINVSIGNKQIDISHITITQWMNIMKWDILDQDNWDKIISIILDDDVYLDDDQKELLISFIISLIKVRKVVPLKDFELLTFGQFVDLEVYLAIGYQNTLDKIIPLLGVETNRIDEALFVFEKWAKWRDFIFKQYKGLFSVDENNDDDIDNKRIKIETQVMKSWYKIIVDLCGGDVLKMDLITDQPYRKILNFMAHQKEQIMIANMEQKKKQRQYELQRNRR